MDEVEKWEEQWGKYGRRNIDLKAHFISQWEALWAEKNIFEETYDALLHRLN